MLAKRGGIGRGPTDVNPNIAAVDPSQLLQRLQQSLDAGLMLRTVCGTGDKHADGPHLLLSGCGARPCDRSTTQHPENLASLHVRLRSGRHLIVSTAL